MINEEIKSSKISLLNKIKHKPILLESIFSFVEKRAFIFPYLIDNDPILKRNLKNSIEPINKKNNLSININDNICKFITFRLLYQIDINKLLEQIKKIFIKEYNKKRLSPFFENKDSPPSLFNYFADIIIEIFKKMKIPDNININQYNILLNLPNGKKMINFIKDYLSVQKEIILLYLPLFFVKIKREENTNFEWTKDKMYKDSEYLYNLSKDKNRKNLQKINLICLINDMNYYDNPMRIDYNYINKLFFVLDETNKDNGKLFEKI